MNEAIEAREDEARKAAMAAARAAMEGLFDAVVILGCWQNEAGGTKARELTDGNWYAQQGMVDAFIRKRVVQDDIETRRRLEAEDDE